MSATMCENLRNLTTGRTDWKVKVRVIREWRGYTLAGEPFKGYNILILDAKVYFLTSKLFETNFSIYYQMIQFT